MSFIRTPNLPDKAVTTVLVDGRVENAVEKKLMELGIRTIKVPGCQDMYDAVAAHPDIFFHHLGGNKIVYAPGVEEGLLKKLLELGFELIEGFTKLSSKYPLNIAYNAARVGKYVLHNLKYTDPLLKNELEKMDLKLVHVNQGYSKCSVAVVDVNSIITSDKGIAREAEKAGIDVLFIEPDNGILLPGLNMGFIGGSTGMIGCKKLAFTGSIENLKSKDSVLSFLDKKGIEAITLKDGPIVDIGSILPIVEE